MLVQGEVFAKFGCLADQLQILQKVRDYSIIPHIDITYNNMVYT